LEGRAILLIERLQALHELPNLGVFRQTSGRCQAAHGQRLIRRDQGRLNSRQSGISCQFSFAASFPFPRPAWERLKEKPMKCRRSVIARQRRSSARLPTAPENLRFHRFIGSLAGSQPSQ
jgi:hypothetical protein